MLIHQKQLLENKAEKFVSVFLFMHYNCKATITMIYKVVNVPNVVEDTLSFYSELLFKKNKRRQPKWVS
ncbi:Uncharacterised protein (plasmid) [Mycoplasmopsis cynos]|uniref:Uncharacterized protein n=2 Tax=Mycoplasmopsis cynos TaxID=171284 RepID=L0RWA1_MYCC1|nr:Hypothetical protein MCYN_0174 [Mycoplasmopsis cynos C142]VEU64514.1 Uncharacterised protein [Mycoplasmopsis cynos]